MILLCAWTCLERFQDRRLLTSFEAMNFLVELLYAGRSLQPKRWAKRERIAEIYRRYVVGEDSMALARVYGVSDRRIRKIIARERKREVM